MNLLHLRLSVFILYFLMLAVKGGLIEPLDPPSIRTRKIPNALVFLRKNEVVKIVKWD